MNDFYTTTALCTLAAYVIGSLPFGFWISRLNGIDIREHGSGNIGATNVFRTISPTVGVAVFVLDVLKGFAPVFIGKKIIESRLPEDLENADQWLGGAAVMLALAAIIGHNYTFWLRFKGGKGIATSAGAMLAFLPWVLLGSLLTWMLVFYYSGYVALASIAAALVIPPLTIVLGLFQAGINWPVVVFGVFASVMAIWRHRGNIVRLRAGEEDRFDRRLRRKKDQKREAGPQNEEGEAE